jgi:hypothetical protein
MRLAHHSSKRTGLGFRKVGVIFASPLVISLLYTYNEGEYVTQRTKRQKDAKLNQST